MSIRKLPRLTLFRCHEMVWSLLNFLPGTISRMHRNDRDFRSDVTDKMPEAYPGRV